MTTAPQTPSIPADPSAGTTAVAAPEAPGTLEITTDPSPLAISVFDHQWNLATRGVSPLRVVLPPGLYWTCGILAGHPDLATFARVVPNATRAVHLSRSDPELTRVASSIFYGLLDKYVHKLQPVTQSSARYTVQEPALQPQPFWIRFLRLKDWETAELLDPLAFSTEYVRGRAILDVTNKRASVIFAQVAGPQGAALNIALPPAGARPAQCQLVVSATSDLLSAHVRLATDWANAALQYMAQGYIDQAKELVAAGKELSEEKPSLIARALRHIANRFDDPSAALVPRYLGLRTGEDTIFNTFGDMLLDVFQPGVADGNVISAEIACRQYQYNQSADRILAIQPGNMPLFTEGFSLLIHRLRDLIDLGAVPDADLDKSKVEQLKQLMRVLNNWAPYLDLNRPTVTFRGNDLTAPRSSDTTPEPTTADGWLRGPEPPTS